jgi:formyltetrahydrofolate deformylase
MDKNQFILTISCDDKVGIVASVAGFLAENGYFIIESAQMGDTSTGKFFMRTVFSSQISNSSKIEFEEKFAPVATKFTMKWSVYDGSEKPRLLIMVSQQGHCLNDLLHRYYSGTLPVEIPAVVSNHPQLKRMVESYEIPFYHMPVSNDGRTLQEEKIVKLIEDENIDLTILARYMQVLTPVLVNKIYGRAINIHHSFLPGFKGAKPYHQAYDRGVKIIGATAHYVSNELDEGPIIEQEVVRVNHSNTPDQLLAIGRDVESLVLSRAVKYHIEHRVILNGNKTVVFV